MKKGGNISAIKKKYSLSPALQIKLTNIKS